MKKLTLILLSVLMIVALAACGSKKCEQHVYDDCADTECNVCGETRDSMHSWKDADCLGPKTCTVCGKTEGSALGHKPAEDDGDCGTDVLCTVCGAVTTPAKLEHIAHADDGDCTTPITCTECGWLMKPAQEHNFNGDWKTDADGHWQMCQNIDCKVAGTKEPHNKGEDGKCTVCGYVVEVLPPHEHSYTVADYDDTHHYTRCACGAIDESTKVSHTATFDNDCTTDDKCTCGCTVTAAKDHVAGADDGDCTTPVKCKNCNQIAVSGNQTHTYGTITYTWADDYSSCTAMRKCTVNGCQSTETETKAATQDGAIFTVDFDNEAFETQRVDTSVQIGNVTVNPWNEVPLIDAGEAEEQYGKENE